MKRFLKIAMILTLAVACMLAFASCAGHEHTFSEDWTSDENNHWHAATCEHTEETSAVGAHTFGEDGKCTVCGYEKPAEHTHTFSEEWSSDAAQHWHAANCEHTALVEDLGSHTWGSNGKCTVCGYGYEAHTEHTFDYSTYVSDETGHWYAAICCNEKDGYAPHTIGEGNKCTVCGYSAAHEHTYSDAWSSDENNHWHAADCGHNAVDSESLAAHTLGDDYKCTVCGYQHIHSFNFNKLESDENGHWYASTCGHNVKSSYEEHTYSGGNFICTTCEHKHEHKYATTLTYDASAHWYADTCGHGTKKGFENHTLDGEGKCACGYSEEVKSIYEIINSCNPTKIVTVIEYVVGGDSSDVLDGEFVTLISGNNMILHYWYKEYSDLTDSMNGEDRIKTVSGSVYYRDGLYSTDGKIWSAEAPSDAELVFNLTSEYLLNAVISEDGNSLTAEIAPENAVEVFGSDLSADGNISLSVETNGVNLFRIVASATTHSGAEVTVKTSYTYNEVVLEYPDGITSGDGEDKADELADFTAAIGNTKPTSASIATSLLTIHSDEPMKGLYDIVYNADGSITVRYAYMKLNEIGEGDGMFSTVSGEASIDADGNVTGDLSGTVTGAASIAVNLDAAKMDYSVSAGILTAKIAAENVESVLGVDTGADTTLTMTVVSGRLVSLTINYVSAAGPVEIVCSYK